MVKKKTLKKKKIEVPKRLSAKETLKRPCYLCGGKVVYVDNAVIYKKSKGLGMCYHCTDCKASVLCTNRYEQLEDGTKVLKPLGILADKETRQLRVRCHQLLDNSWKYQCSMKRSTAYRKLAKSLNIPYETCHFALMNKKQLYYVIDVLTKTRWRSTYF